MKRHNSFFQPRSWPIAVKLSVALVCTALIPMLLTAYYNLQGSLASVSSTELRNLQQLATSTASRVGQALRDIAFLSDYLATEAAIGALIGGDQETATVVRSKLQRLISANDALDLLLLLDAEGTVVSAPTGGFIGRNYRFRDYFQTAVKGRPYVSNIIVGDVTGKPGVFFSSPVRAPNGLIGGVVVAKIKGETVFQLVDQAARREHTAFLVDGDGVLIHHPDRRLLYRSLRPLQPVALQRIVDSKRFMRDSIDSLGLVELGDAVTGARRAGYVSYRSALSNEAEIAGYAPVPGHDWVVVVSALHASFAAPLTRLFNNVAYSVAAIGVVFVGIALLLARGFVRPIRQLIVAAERVRAGDYEAAEAPVTARDEFGALTRTFNLMVAGIRERERERDIFGRVVSPEVREKLLKGDLQLGGENRRVTVLFSDIRGFSTMSEQMSPGDVVAFLNEYLTEMTEAVKPWNGYINNFIGDAIVVIFGAPLNQEGTESNAVSAALAMRQRLEVINLRRAQLGDPPVRSGIGISTGKVVAGQIGSLERFLYTVIGDSVNVAARLEALSKDYPQYSILMNEATAEGVAGRDDLTLVNLGQQQVKGRVEPVNVYGVEA